MLVLPVLSISFNKRLRTEHPFGLVRRPLMVAYLHLGQILRNQSCRSDIDPIVLPIGLEVSSIVALYK
jgi:hypothetical protein